MKKQNILLSILSIACLVGCGQQPAGQSSTPAGGDSSGAPKEDNSLIEIKDFGTFKLEAENFNVDNWIPDASYGDEIIVEDAKASNKAYLAAGKRNSAATATFQFKLEEFSKVEFAAAYAQTEDWLEDEIDLAVTYNYNVESVSPFLPVEGKSVLPARKSASSWAVIPYTSQELYAGTYNVTLTVMANTPKGCPSIDYVQFKVTDPNAQPPIDPSTITEDDIPDNDMRNLQQYKYLMDEDVTKYKTYATGADLSAPRGMKLKFDDVETASKYYVQVSEDQTFANATVREATNKYYYFQNAKLATKYYYRAATSEAGLASAAVKEITSTSMAPRVVSVPDVLNFRDIGGWESSLVPGAKINQGMYFRCAQLNGGNGSTTSKLDSAGKGLAALKELGIKVDIDMRDSYNVPSKSPADTTDWPVSLVKASVPSGSEPVRWEGGSYSGTNIADQYKTIFNALAECDTKPAMLHCTYGADRTGIATFFLEALLGMSEEDMTRDYLWTQFTQGRTVKYSESDAEFPKWIEKTNACQGDTFADKMENHLMEFGIEKSTLEHIREIFVPGYVAQN